MNISILPVCSISLLKDNNLPKIMKIYNLFQLISYTTFSANLMLREIGIVLFLAGV